MLIPSQLNSIDSETRLQEWKEHLTITPDDPLCILFHDFMLCLLHCVSSHRKNTSSRGHHHHLLKLEIDQLSHSLELTAIIDPGYREEIVCR